VTRRDLLEGNVDLIAQAMSILDSLPHYWLASEVRTGKDNKYELAIMPSSIDRVDVYIDDRPRQSLDVKD
jgi:hypothetical protein